MPRKQKKDRSQIMASIRSRDTRPEMTARRWLWTHGYRYRKNDSNLPGTPDIALRHQRVAIFIHGCFWHQHEGCREHNIPKSNTEFWTAKFQRNKERDQRVRQELRALGWRTMVIWECQLKPCCAEQTMQQASAFIDEAEAERHTLRSRAYTNAPDYDDNLAAAEDYADY